MPSEKSYYEILDVKPGATQEEITESYEKLALVRHPDKNQHDTTEEMQLLNSVYEILKDPGKRKEYDINNGFNQTVSSNTSDEQDIILTPELRDIYLKVLEELLPKVNDLRILLWMENMIKLEAKYHGLTDSFDILNKNLTPVGELAKILLQQFVPDDATKNIRNAKIVIKKHQDYSELYNELLEIPEVLEKLEDFVKHYKLGKTELPSDVVKQSNGLTNSQKTESTSTTTSITM